MTTKQMLDERYGRVRSPRRRILWWSVVAVIALTAVGALGWSTFARSVDAVDVDGTGFGVTDEHRVSVSFQVTTPPGRAFACALEAQDQEHGVVGWRVVQYAASDRHERAFDEEIPTLALATTGFVNSCWVL